MINLLFYDSETTGLPLWREPSSHPGQPHIIQLHAEMVNEETRDTIEVVSSIIKPDGWTISPEITEMTGITQEQAMDEGRPIAEVLHEFMLLWPLCNKRIGHAESFDARMIRIELKRDPRYGDDGADLWKSGASFCTKNKSMPLMKAKKGPKLSEAYKFFTGKDLVGAHQADIDVMATKAVYFAIADRAE